MLGSRQGYSAVDPNMDRLHALHSQHSASRNASVYTLNTLDYREDASSDAAHLVSPENLSYGSTFPRHSCIPPSARIIFNATLKMAVVFIVSTVLLGGTLWLALPTLDAYAVPLSCFSSFVPKLVLYQSGQAAVTSP